MFVVLIKKKAEKQYHDLRMADRQRVVAAFQELRENPWQGKKLEGEQEGHWSLRVWPYRIIYTIEKQIVTVTVVTIGHRKDVYRRLRPQL